MRRGSLPRPRVYLLPLGVGHPCPCRGARWPQSQLRPLPQQVAAAPRGARGLKRGSARALCDLGSAAARRADPPHGGCPPRLRSLLAAIGATPDTAARDLHVTPAAPLPRATCSPSQAAALCDTLCEAANRKTNGHTQEGGSWLNVLSR